MSENDFLRVFSARLRFYLNRDNMTQRELACRLGVGNTSVYNWVNGIKSPRMDKVDAMCKIFGCMRSDLMDETHDATAPSKGVKINVLGRVAAGIPIEAIENIIDTEEITAEMARRGEYFGLKVKGTSMQPVICDGDIVIVRKQEDADSDEIVIATVNGDDATCKRLMKYDGGLSLISYNPEFAPMTFTDKQLEEIPVRIIGRVVEERRKF